MKQEYYYLTASLPELLGADRETKHPLPSFFAFCKEELSPPDQDELGRCFIFNDVLNVLGIPREDYVFVHPSYYGEEELREGLRDPDSLFPFLADYLYEKKAGTLPPEKLTPEDQLLRRLYQELDSFAQGFVRDYLLFEGRCRSLCLALSRRAQNQDSQDLIVPEDYFCEQLVKSSAPDFGLAGEIAMFEPLLDLFGKAPPIEIEKKIDEIRWFWLDQTVDYHLFSREAVFAYAVKIHSMERWLTLDPQEGKKKLNTLINQVKERV